MRLFKKIMSNYEKRFSELNQYLGGLFHQYWKNVFDWKGQNESFEGVVRYFKVRNSEHYEKEELKELKEFLNLGLTESEIENVMDEWNIAYYPYGANMTYIEWLNDVLGILEEPMEKTKKEFIPEFIG